jgi:hypothetical protein
VVLPWIGVRGNSGQAGSAKHPASPETWQATLTDHGPAFLGTAR